MIDIGGGDAQVLPRMAPDLLYLSSKTREDVLSKAVSLTGTTSLVTALQLTGRWAISELYLMNYTAGTLTVKLTIDGEVIWDTTITLSGSYTPFAMLGYQDDELYMCASSLKLEVKHSSSTSMLLKYMARPMK